MTHVLSANLGKYFTTTWNIDIIYDDDVRLFGNNHTSPSFQLKSIIGAGYKVKPLLHIYYPSPCPKCCRARQASGETVSLPPMGQKKLMRFEELKTFPNVLQYPGDMAGKWNEFFKNENPIILELACGKGEYAIGLGQLYAQRNFVGIDLKGNRLWVGAEKALRNNLGNVAFLRTQIDKATEYFGSNEVAEIWITFPDPQLRFSKAKKRLTHPKFLRLYQQFLVPGGLIHVKTDSPQLYAFTKLVVAVYGCVLHNDYADTYNQENIKEELQIKTHYELLDIAGTNRIYYCCFSLPENLPGKEKDDELKQLLKEHEGAD